MSSEMDQVFESIIGCVGERVPMQPVELDPVLARPKSRLKVLDATHYNWAAPRFRKLFAMQFKVRIPPLDQMNSIFYPETGYDFPIFIFFCLKTKRKVIAHVNVNCAFEDADYLAKWVDPLAGIMNRYPSFESEDRYPEWMKKYRNACTIFGMYPQDRFDDIRRCAVEYLAAYMERVKRCEPVSDPARVEHLKAFQNQFIDDIRTQDKAQGMIAKMIGKDKARRIFYEITT